MYRLVRNCEEYTHRIAEEWNAEEEEKKHIKTVNQIGEAKEKLCICI